jgi:hypothetical protein
LRATARLEYGQRCSGYSCAEICWSESRHALIFRRRHTQQRFSSSGTCGPVKGIQGAPQTAHGFDGAGRSGSTDFLAISKISGEMIGSAIGFFFMLLSL